MDSTTTLHALTRENYLSLTTFRRSGQGVPTAVWFARDDDGLVVLTGADSGKVKRIRNGSRVTIAACTARGTVTGPVHEAHAIVLPASDGPRVLELLNRKYSVQKRLFDLVMRLGRLIRRQPPLESAYLRITLIG